MSVTLIIHAILTGIICAINMVSIWRTKPIWKAMNIIMEKNPCHMCRNLRMLMLPGLWNWFMHM